MIRNGSDPRLRSSELRNGRHELKYLIRPDHAAAIADFVQPYLELDKYCVSRADDQYTVRSIYYDSPSLACFHEKLDGVRTRHKYRVRSYNEALSVAYLENKRKVGNTHHKTKTRLTPDTLDALARRDYHAMLLRTDAHAGAQVLDQLAYRMARDAFAPLALIVYEREAYVYPGQHDIVRLTFDRHLRAKVYPDLSDLHVEAGLTPLLYHWTILEIKFTGLIPHWFRRLNTLFHLKRQACSKFGMSVAQLLGESPRLKDGLRYASIY